MNELWQIALDHHLYILVPAGIGVWLWNRGGTVRKPATAATRGPQPVRPSRTGSGWTAAWTWLTRRADRATPSTAQLDAEAARLQAQQRELEGQIATLEAEPAGWRPRRGGRPGAPGSGGGSRSDDRGG